MDELLPYYEAELRLLCAQAARFAQAHPTLAQELEITGEGYSEDGQVQHLLQAAALLNARISRRIEDQFAIYTRSLLQRLFPQGLRPFPACSIAAFGPDAKAAALEEATAVPRGTRLKSAAVRKVVCEFRTAFDVMLWPLRVADVSFRAAGEAPAGVRLPAGTGALLSLRLEHSGKDATWPTPSQPPLRLYLGGDAARVAALREALCTRVLGVLLQSEPQGAWRAADGALPRPVGFGDGESLLEGNAFPQAGQRLLAEYFVFPRKFDFIDLPWPAGLKAATGREVVLHYALAGPVAGSPQARLLEGVSAQDLVPGCTPVVNLFPRRVRPVPDSREPARYTVVADVEKPWSCEVYALERLRCGAEQSRPDDASPDIPPLFSLHPGRFTGPDLYWVTPDDADDVGPVHGALIALVTAGMEPVPLDGATLWADITATNADLPMALEPGSALDLDGGCAACTARLLHQPTPSRRFDLRGQAPWRLISHLSPNHLWLCDCGIEAIRDMLQLYDLPRSASSQRLVQGMQAVDARPASALLYDPEPYLARGTELCLTVDEACFGDTGPLLFAWVMERWFAQLAHINSFTRLKLVSARGTEVFSGKTRPGDRPLL